MGMPENEPSSASDISAYRPRVVAICPSCNSTTAIKQKSIEKILDCPNWVSK